MRTYQHHQQGLIRVVAVCLIWALSALRVAAVTADDSSAPQTIERLRTENAFLKAALQAREAQIARLTGQAPPAAASGPARSFGQSPSASSEATSALPRAPAAPEDVVQMSSFVVRTTQGAGYSAGNAASALKNNQSLMDTPQQIIVITNDLIKDIGGVASTDVLQFAGASTYFRGESVASRGSSIGYPYVDDMPDRVPYSDDVDVDAYEIIKGPVQMFYALGALAGTVLKTTKEPLQHPSYVVSASIDQWGGRRLTYDFTGPVGGLGGGRLSYRLVGAFQGGGQYFQNVLQDHFAVYPTLEWDWNKTTVIVKYDFQTVVQPDSWNGWLTPTGGLYTGAGRSAGQAPDSNVHFTRRDLRGTWIQSFSPDWNMKFAAAESVYSRFGAELYPGSVDYANNTVSYQPFLNNEWNEGVQVQDDFSGKYEIATIPNRSSFGFNIYDDVEIAQFNTNNPSPTIPLGSAAAINALRVPQQSLGQWPALANPGNRTKTYVESLYYMHQVDVVPNLLSLVGGVTFSTTEAVSDPNLAVKAPYTSTDLNSHALLHRLGVLVHVTKDILLYGNESETYAANRGVDFNNNPLAPVFGKSDEVGFKTSFWEGRLSTTVGAFKMQSTNQAVVASFTQTNAAGVFYYIPIGTTTTRGWDGSMTLGLVPGWQLIATAYLGTVKDRFNNPTANTYDNSYSIFTRYDFARTTILRRLAIGGGVVRIGGRWVSPGGLTLPANFTIPANSSGSTLFKMAEGTDINLFASYDLSKHWSVRVNAENILNQAYPLGAQGAVNIDPVDPSTVSFAVTFKY
jgi:outer membrane receptor for ferric coprogen and ferric-rhodotorulic acid